jgi:hypothetical protein
VFVAYYRPYVTGYSKLCLGDGVGGYTCRDLTESTRSQQSTISDVSHLDLNLDGLPDLMLEDNGGGSGSPGEYCLNQPGAPGTFTCAVAPFPTVTYTGSPWGFASNDQKVVDLDNDGDDDLVFGSRGDAFACWSDGAGGLSCGLLSGASQSAIETGAAAEVDVADLNDDALPDVLVTNGENISGILQCLNNGDRTFACTTAIPSPRFGSLAVLGTEAAAADGDGICQPSDVVDGDLDAIADDCDLCPTIDAAAADLDADGCLDDTDEDGVTDDLDLCPAVSAVAADLDGDGCLDDTDEDGVTDDLDLCPAVSAVAADLDGDGCLDDSDADGVTDDADLCPAVSAVAADLDGDGCLDDTDEDGVTDDLDLCPAVSAVAADLDGDGCLDDSDADGVTDDADLCPAVSAVAADLDGDGCLDDTDDDGITDDLDLCPLVSAVAADLDGDGCLDDTDADGVTDDLDLCPGADDAADADTDTVPDCLDLCPAVSAVAADLDGDGCLDDSDADGVTDDLDLCPGADDAADADTDAVPDCLDLCPAVSAVAADLDGDGCLDDTDGDGVTDDVDACPTVDATGRDADGDGCLDPTGGPVTTFVTNDFGPARDGFQACENSTGAWVCTTKHFPAFAGRFYGATFLAFDANQDGRVGFIAAAPANLQCEPDDTAPNGWDCQEFLPQGPEDGQIWDLIAEDLNGDGVPDLGFASHITGTGHCLGGTFPMSCAFDGIASGPNFDNLDYADFNADGIIDVFVAYYLPYVTGYSKLCLGDGAGGYTCRDLTESTRSQQSTVSDVSHLDLNLDGLPDLMLEDNGGGSGSPGEYCLNQPGAPGTFACAVAPFPTVTYTGSPWGFASNDQKVVDLDNDGDDDLVFGSRGDAFACWSDGAGALSCGLLSGASQSAIETGSAQEVDVAELNGDGLPDVLVTNGENISGILQCLNNGDRTFDCTTAIPSPRFGSLAVLDVEPAPAPIDGDGVCHPSDVIDGDLDTIADDCDDCPTIDASAADLDGDGCLDDTDDDGVTDDVDLCPADSAVAADLDGDGCLDDTDADGVTDDLDVCPGADDAADADADSVPDCLDRCPAGSDDADDDADGVPDACDLCPGADDTADADGDGAPDACDVCALGPDDLDADADTVADACDVCPGADDLEDPDSDGVLGCLDLCPDVSGAAGDDDGDGCLDVPDDDLDGVPDDVDLCIGDDSTGDEDGDGVCDDVDLCVGDDAAGDADLDGYCADGTDAADGDCDDDAELAFPDAEEICDGLDNDCDGVLPNPERDLNGNGLPDCTCDAPPCKRGEFVDDQGSFACDSGGTGVSALPFGLLLLLATRRRQVRR